MVFRNIIFCFPPFISWSLFINEEDMFAWIDENVTKTSDHYKYQNYYVLLIRLSNVLLIRSSC